jgi:hypothetical protein
MLLVIVDVNVIVLVTVSVRVDERVGYTDRIGIIIILGSELLDNDGVSELEADCEPDDVSEVLDDCVPDDVSEPLGVSDPEGVPVILDD